MSTRQQLLDQGLDVSNVLEDTDGGSFAQIVLNGRPQLITIDKLILNDEDRTDVYRVEVRELMDVEKLHPSDHTESDEYEVVMEEYFTDRMAAVEFYANHISVITEMYLDNAC